MAAPHFLLALLLEGRLCVVVGTDAEAERRTRALLEHGARVRLVSPRPAPALASWAAQEAQVELLVAEPEAKHLDDAWLCVVADRNPVWMDLLGPLAAARRLPFCAVDEPRHNTFSHVAVARAASLQIGVSTSGHAPGLAAALRRELQSLLDRSGFEGFVRRVQDAREGAPVSERRRVVEKLLERLSLDGLLRH